MKTLPWKQTGIAIIKYSMIFAGMILLYLFLLTAVWSIPAERIEENRAAAVTYIETQEGLYPTPFYSDRASTLDNFTDRSMMRHMVPVEKYNVLENALWAKNYARYWHGYQTFLRPLLAFSSYQQIRSLITVCYALLFFACFYLLARRTNFWMGLGFVLSMTAVRCFLIPASLQYSNMFLLMLAGSCLVLLRYRQGKSWLLFFFVLGSVTNFLDYLTTPILTLGIPLLILTLLDAGSLKTSRQLGRMIQCSVLWTIAYALTWAAKWVLATLILKRDIISDAIKTIFFRVNGSEEAAASRLGAVSENLHTLLSARMLCVILALLLIFLVLLVRGHKSRSACMETLPLLALALYPYVWYTVLANHSQIHAFFTYRNQLLSLLALFAAGWYCLDFSKLKK